MAFKPVTANTQRAPFITITASGRERGIALSKTVRLSIGEPRGIAFEWDDDEALLRITAASPESPDASRLPVSCGRGVAATTLLRQLGIHVDATTRVPVTQDGPLAVIADLSPHRSKP